MKVSCQLYDPAALDPGIEPPRSGLDALEKGKFSFPYS